MIVKRFWSIALSLTGFFVFTAVAVAQDITFTLGPVHTVDVSGKPALRQTTQTPSEPSVLYSLRFGESASVPCYLDTRWWTLDGEDSTDETTMQFNKCDGPLTKLKHILITRAHAGFTGVTGLQVCNNDRTNSRLKGANITNGSTLLVEDGSGVIRGSNLAGDGFKLPDCDVQSPVISRCPEYEMAVGLVIHVLGDSITGLALRCASVQVEVTP